MKKVKDEFFIFQYPKEWLKVDGDPVVMPGFEEYDLFVHEAVDDDGYLYGKFNVSEGKTGYRVSRFMDSKEEAIEHATKLLTDHGKDCVDELIKQSIEKDGLSPRWSMED
jgi:hypothetical protein